MIPAGPPGDERVVLDATLVVIPGTVTGFALDLGAGRLTIGARLVGGQEPRQALLTFLGYRGYDPLARVEVPVGRDGWSGIVALAGGVYTCNLAVNAPANAPTGDDDASVELAPFTQRVALRMTLAPQ
ncbi:MAG: hypothetical protein M3O34_01905 [Chloroflexota bacterium]|nr:hypothetical protein [Chloroflexota bacterium]